MTNLFCVRRQGYESDNPGVSTNIFTLITDGHNINLKTWVHVPVQENMLPVNIWIQGCQFDDIDGTISLSSSERKRKCFFKI